MELIVFIGNSGYAYKAMEVAKDLGATGGTIIHGRSNSKKDRKLFGITIHQEKDVLLIVALSHSKKLIMEGLNKNLGIKSPANGMMFSLAVSKAYGIKSNIRDLGNMDDLVI